MRIPSKKWLVIVIVFTLCIVVEASPAGYCLEFDGEDDYIEIHNAMNIGIGSNTVEMWIQVPEVGTNNLDPGERVGVLLGNYDALPCSNWEIYSSGELRFYWNGGTTEILGTTDLRDANWHHIAFVRDKDNNKIIAYIDGVEEFNVVGCGPDVSFTSSFAIGDDIREGGSPHFHGKIDDLRIWTDTRTPEEIRMHMYTEVQSSEANLIAYYDFNAGSGTNIDNTETTSSFDGTMFNMNDEAWVPSNAFFHNSNAIDFDGIDDYISCGTSATLRPTESITVEAWIYTRSCTHWEGVVCNLQDNFSEESGYGLFFITNVSTELIWWVKTTDTAVDQAQSGNCPEYPIPLNKWVHVAGVYDFDACMSRMFINGEQVDSMSLTGTINWAFPPIDMAIGNYKDDNENNYFDGMIDDVRIWNDARSVNEIKENMFIELVGNEANLIAYYRMNGDSLSIAGIDDIDNSNGSLTGSMTEDDLVKSGAFEGANNAIHFDGIDDYITIPFDVSLQPTDEITIEIWAKPDDWTPDAIQSIFGNTDFGGYAFALKNDYLFFFVGYSSGYATCSLQVGSLTEWHHLAGSFDGRYAKLYLDGKIADIYDLGTSSNPINYTKTNNVIIGAEAGADASATGWYLAGETDEARIWNRALSANEIRRNMCRSLSGNEAGLVTYYRLDENDSDRAIDIANGHNGTLANMDLETCRLASGAFTTWIGISSTVWNDNANWSDGFPNAVTENVYISDGFSQAAIGATYNCNNLIIPENSLIDINSGNLIINSNYYQLGGIQATGGNLIIKNKAFSANTEHRIIIGGEGAIFSSMPLFD